MAMVRRLRLRSMNKNKEEHVGTPMVAPKCLSRFYRQQFATQAAGLLTQSSAVELGLGGSGLRVVESSLVTTTKTMASRLLIAAGGAACIDTLNIRFLVFLGGWGASVGDAQ